MAKQIINVGANANDGSGDPARTVFTKINQNMNEIYATYGNGNNLFGVGTNADQIMKVGAFGLGAKNDFRDMGEIQPFDLFNFGMRYGLMKSDQIGVISSAFIGALVLNAWQDTSAVGAQTCILFLDNGSLRMRVSSADSTKWEKTVNFYSTGNTTTDGNGYLKPSSPVVRLFADKVELINEAVDQGITFEKLGVGDYLVKNTTGLRDDGWYIETPRDSNGNVLVFVEFIQLENKDISVKTFKKKFDIDTASIVADHTKPMDIPTDRWIDLRFNDYPIAEQPTPEATA